MQVSECSPMALAPLGPVTLRHQDQGIPGTGAFTMAVDAGYFGQQAYRKPQISKDSNEMSKVGTLGNRHCSAFKILATKADCWWKEITVLASCPVQPDIFVP